MKAAELSLDYSFSTTIKYKLYLKSFEEKLI